MRTKLLDTGVYVIRCLTNSKVYVGSAASSLSRRIVVHRSMLRSRIHYNSHLQRAWNKYGKDAFEFLVVERCAPDVCLVREQHWINHYCASDRKTGFNLCPTADSCFGRRNSEETLAKMSASAKRRHAIFPRPWIGRKHTAETKAKIAAANKGQGLGRKLPAETRAKIGATHRGRKASLESRKKMSASQRGHSVSEETRAKISATKKACGLSEEVRANIRARYIPDDKRNGQHALAREYGVSRCAIQKILKHCR